MRPTTTSLELPRRRFLQVSSTLAAAALFGRHGWAAESPAPQSADAYIQGKDRRLIVHSTKTGEIETPLTLLRDHRLTPKSLLFVRTNQVLPDTLTIAPLPLEPWKIELSGLIDPVRTVSAAELAKLPQQEIEVVLQCSGNSRSRFARTVAAEGVPWQHGAMGNVTFRGVWLKDLLAHCQATPKDSATYLTAEGKDVPLKPGTPDFEHSIPLNDALDRSLLALAMNGEPLPAVHGGPVRLVTPGFYATMNVKWLSALRFESAESSNYHHVGRYRTPLKPLKPGSEFTSTLRNSEPNWNMRIKSVIFGPLEGDAIRPGPVVVHGVAWNDGTAKLDAVEVSLDQGQTWRRAELTRPASPYAWHPWKLTVMLPVGKTMIWSRAADASGRTQPLDGSIAWNPAGYAWNGVDEVNVIAQA